MDSIQKQYLDMMYECGLVCGITDYTRIEAKLENISKFVLITYLLDLVYNIRLIVMCKGTGDI